MFGSGLTWFYRYLAGVRPDEQAAGFRHIVIRPYWTEQLPEVYYAYQTPYGEVISDIHRTENQWEIRVTIPVGSHATLYLPTVHGVLVEQATGVKRLPAETEGLSLRLDQGSYCFQFPG